MPAAAMRNFDTLRSFNTLKARGVPEKLAKTLIGIIKEANENSIEHLATSAELQLTKAELTQQIAHVDSSLRAEISEVRRETAILRTDVQFLKRLYFSGTAATLAAIALLFLQRH